jgi:hypothetical protein
MSSWGTWAGFDGTFLYCLPRRLHYSAQYCCTPHETALLNQGVHRLGSAPGFLAPGWRRYAPGCVGSLKLSSKRVAWNKIVSSGKQMIRSDTSEGFNLTNPAKTFAPQWLRRPGGTLRKTSGPDTERICPGPGRPSKAAGEGLPSPCRWWFYWILTRS